MKLGTKIWAILVLFSIIRLGIYNENIEHTYPTPPEWSWTSRSSLRSAQTAQDPETTGPRGTSWSNVAQYYKLLLIQLEHPEMDGQGIIDQDEGGFLVEGVGRTGFDVSAKSEPWRRGYFQALMGSAKAAENLDGWVTDHKQRISAPAKYVVGPSNPRPKPLPAGQKKAPQEADCKPASPPPETFYMKILTTKGFDARQKIDAALAYADWLDFKGLNATASDMYTWALDIATSGLEGDADKIVDMKTGLLKNNAGHLPSENLLRVSTAIAVHSAREGDLPNALSIFTSVLKAQRSMPLAPTSGVPATSSLSPHTAKDPISGFFRSIKTLFVPPEYPQPLPSGNEPPLRNIASACEEAGLMTYIGEILYASSSKETGLAWTRDAVEIAETTLLDLSDSSDSGARDRCAQCLKVGLENWKTMVSSLVTRAQQEEKESREKAKSSWFGGERRAQAKSLECRRWEAEDEILGDRIRRLLPLLRGQSGLKSLAPASPYSL